VTMLPSGSMPPRAGNRRRYARRSPTRLVLGIVLRLVLLAAVFAVGIALGESLHDNPKPGDSRTQTRQLRPVSLPPVTRTITVTTRG
jgi:hypothetical protein